MMMLQGKIDDSTISRKVTEKLSSSGIRAPCRVTVASSKGNITLAGSIQYEHQRHAALRAVKSVTGVLRVMDQMKVTPKKPPAKTLPKGAI
jgi:osmotically-inducible protein OsmY